MDASKRERERASHMKENFPEFTHEFPLIEHCLTKNDCHYLLQQLGIKRPVMYDLGYDNNNCIGCVKGGMWYWNKIRIDFPEVFEKMAKLEREVGHSCINGCFLDELERGRGTKGSELTGDCSVACYFTASEKGLL